MSYSPINTLRILFPAFSYPYESRFLKYFQSDHFTTNTNASAAVSSTRPKSGIMRIDLTKIKLGKDIRTSIMIKNLPQFLTYDEISDSLGISSYINYMYIPTMSNCPNKILGFAFVNVIKPIYIINIIEIMQSKKHSFPFILDKNPEICYAKIQGKDALVQTFEKFNQHSLMNV
jgi:RNA recognition motif-containing protein